MKHDLIKNCVEDLKSVEQPDGIKSDEIRFALNTLQGFGVREAYRLSIGSRAEALDHTKLSRRAHVMKNKPIVKKYLAALVRELERVAVANALDLQMFLSAAIFTPIGQIDEHHPLCQEKIVAETTHKDGTTSVVTKTKSVSKSECAKILIRMKGLDAPIKVDVNHRGGVMIVPMASSVEDWERLAANSQKLLMQDAVNID